MLGALPTNLIIGGKKYEIRSDYRNILRIIEAYDSTELKDREKVYICLKRLYVAFEDIPPECYEEAYKAATSFIECQMETSKHDNSPRLVDWSKDGQLIFAAVNKVAGKEVRAEPYMHWWTFMGYFQSIDRDDLWGFILTIRQKKAKHQKLEKYEQEFYTANRSMCDVGPVIDRKKQIDDYAEALFAELLSQQKG